MITVTVPGCRSTHRHHLRSQGSRSVDGAGPRSWSDGGDPAEEVVENLVRQPPGGAHRRLDLAEAAAPELAEDR
jgi:hypothetical protein